MVESAATNAVMELQFLLTASLAIPVSEAVCLFSGRGFHKTSVFFTLSPTK